MPRRTPRRPARSHFEGLEPLEQRLSLAVNAWTGAGDGLRLMDPANWDHNHVPRSNEIALIETTAPLLMDAGSMAVQQLVLRAPLAMTGGVINIGLAPAEIAGSLDLQGGLLVGAGGINLLGEMNWTGGAIARGGDLEVAPGATLTIEGLSALVTQRNINNQGRLEWRGGDLNLSSPPEGEGDPHRHQSGLGHTISNGLGHIGEVPAGVGIVLMNEAGGLFRATGTGTIHSVGEAAVVGNLGTVIREGDGVSTIAACSDNEGDINVLGGTLWLTVEGDNTGIRRVGAEGTLAYNGNFTHGAGSTLTGGGRTVWQGHHTLTADWAMASYLYILGAEVDGPGNWQIDGILRWTSGSIAGPGAMAIGETGKLEIRTDGDHHLARSVDSNGTLVWSRGPLAVEDATITNHEGHFFFVAADNAAVEIGESRIVNQGELRKQLSTSAGFGGIALDNPGFLNVRNGTLTLDEGTVAQLDGTTLTGGSWASYARATLEAVGAHIEVIAPGVSINRYGPAGLHALDTLIRNEGSLTIAGGYALEVTPEGGVFTNAGTISLGDATTMRVHGQFVHQSGATLTIGLSTDRPLVSGRVVADAIDLAGGLSLNFLRGYQPAAGAAIVFLAAPTITGNFTSNENSGPLPPLVYFPQFVEIVF